MNTHGRRAIVIGASIGGMAAARVLAERYDEVILIERDTLGETQGSRKGVPQDRHAHGLLARGRQVVENLFPGIAAELIDKGAIAGDLSADSIWYNHGVYLAQAPSGLEGLLVSRPALEVHIRRRLLQLPNVRLIDRCQVMNLSFDEAGQTVTGIKLKRAKGAAHCLAAELVIDAMGRSTRSPAWLVAHGYEAPEEETVEVGIGYTTRLYRRRASDLGGNLVAAIRGGAPLHRFGVALAQEDDSWIVTLGGYLGDAAPDDEEGFQAFARSLPTPDLHALVRGAEPLSEFRRFRFPASKRRRYERLARFPKGYLVFGDALCSFNPAYGQGMSAALIEAELLAEYLDTPPTHQAHNFFAKASKMLDIPWQIAVGNDLKHPQVVGRRTLFGQCFGWYIAKLHRAAARDPRLARSFIEVANLMAPPPALLRPTTMWRTLIGNLTASPYLTPAEAH
jgi:2-polyprenyl-6-methoxyphenol hydroxylase-like FAD-dependent oxidoreductase